MTLRRADVSRISGQWQDEDYDVFDGEREVGRIYRVNAHDEILFWGLGSAFDQQLFFAHSPEAPER